jgi:hypothetical protein
MVRGRARRISLFTEQGHWAAVLALLPEQLPTPPRSTHASSVPPSTSVRSDEDLSYECSLPPSILAVRKYVLALPPRA